MTQLLQTLPGALRYCATGLQRIPRRFEAPSRPEDALPAASAALSGLVLCACDSRLSAGADSALLCPACRAAGITRPVVGLCFRRTLARCSPPGDGSRWPGTPRCPRACWSRGRCSQALNDGDRQLRMYPPCCGAAGYRECDGCSSLEPDRPERSDSCWRPPGHISLDSARPPAALLRTCG